MPVRVTMVMIMAGMRVMMPVAMIMRVGVAVFVRVIMSMAMIVMMMMTVLGFGGRFFGGPYPVTGAPGLTCGFLNRSERHSVVLRGTGAGIVFR